MFCPRLRWASGGTCQTPFQWMSYLRKPYRGQGSHTAQVQQGCEHQSSQPLQRCGLHLHCRTQLVSQPPFIQQLWHNQEQPQLQSPQQVEYPAQARENKHTGGISSPAGAALQAASSGCRMQLVCQERIVYLAALAQSAAAPGVELTADEPPRAQRTLNLSHKNTDSSPLGNLQPKPCHGLVIPLSISSSDSRTVASLIDPPKLLAT